MTYFIAHFKPEHFYPVPEGTILRYRGHHQNFDTKQYSVYMDVIGAPTDVFKDKEHQFLHAIDTDIIHIPLVD